MTNCHERNINQVKKYLIVKGCAGIGNRLITVLDAVNYSKRNNRKIVIDWSDGQFDEKNVDAFGKCFQLKGVDLCKIDEIDNWDSLSHSSEHFKNSKDSGVYDLYKEVHSELFSALPVKLLPKGFFRKLRRRWQSVKNSSFFDSIPFGSDMKDDRTTDVVYYVDFLPQINYSTLPENVQLNATIQNKMENFVHEFKVDTLTGIHVRYTDKRPVADIKKFIGYLKNKQIKELFLATDSSEIERLFINEFPNVILYPKLKPELKSEGLHQWALYNNEEKLKYKIYEDSVIEMFALSKCRYLYYQGNSSFSNVSKVYHANQNNCFDWQKIK